MAKLYYCNNGVMDLQPATLAALEQLPKAWDVLLNLRPVNAQAAREVDAVVITEKALHVLEFKRRRAPITIVTESRWLCDGREMRNSVRGGESPAEQVLNATKAFEEVLTGPLHRFRDTTLPWVVLETYNAKNRVKDKSMPKKDWHDCGYVKVIHGLEHLKEILERRENGKPNRFTDQDTNKMLSYFGAKPLGHLTVQGVAGLAEVQKRLSDTRLRFTTRSQKVFETVTDEHGNFELKGLPLEPFDVELPDHLDLRVLPGATFKANTELLVMHLFLVQPHIGEERVQELLHAGMTSVQQDVEAALALAQEAEQRTAQIEQQLDETRQSIAAMTSILEVHSTDTLQEMVNSLARKVEQLEAERRRVEAVAHLEPQTVLSDALTPFQSQLDELAQRVGAVEERLEAVHTAADEASQQAQVAYRKAEDIEFRVEDIYSTAADARQTANNASQRAGTAYRKATHLEHRVEDVFGRVDGVHETAVSARQEAGRAYRKAEQLDIRVENVFETAQTAYHTAKEATTHAQQSATNAYNSATSARRSQEDASRSKTEAEKAAREAEESRKVQEERLKREQEIYSISEERQTRRAEALKLSAIVGAVGGMVSMQPIPFADNVILTPMQIWMVVRIGQIYGQGIGQDAALKLIGTMGFGFAAQHATIAMYKLVPGLTFGLGPFTVFGFTVLLGAATAMFYERGNMPDKAEQGQLLGRIKNLLKNKEFADEVKGMGASAAEEFKQRGGKPTSETLQAVFAKVGERARPIGERLERELFRGGEREF